MSAPSSEDARDVPPGSVPPFSADDPKISAYLAHLAHVGDEMAAGLGALFAEKFPEVPTLVAIHEDFQFSKNDSLLLFAGLDGNALTLAKAQAEGGTAAEMRQVPFGSCVPCADRNKNIIYPHMTEMCGYSQLLCS